MQTDAAPLYEEFDLGDSSVVELRCSKVGVYVIVEAYRVTAPQPSRIEVFFPEHRGFVLLDEGDMPTWLGAECFRSNHLLYQVLHGGWFDKVSPECGLLAVAGATSREWLIVTANDCVSVFSDVEPLVRDLPGCGGRPGPPPARHPSDDEDVRRGARRTGRSSVTMDACRPLPCRGGPGVGAGKRTLASARPGRLPLSTAMSSRFPALSGGIRP